MRDTTFPQNVTRVLATCGFFSRHNVAKRQRNFNDQVDLAGHVGNQDAEPSVRLDDDNGCAAGNEHGELPQRRAPAANRYRPMEKMPVAYQTPFRPRFMS